MISRDAVDRAEPDRGRDEQEEQRGRVARRLAARRVEHVGLEQQRRSPSAEHRHLPEQDQRGCAGRA